MLPAYVDTSVPGKPAPQGPSTDPRGDANGERSLAALALAALAEGRADDHRHPKGREQQHGKLLRESSDRGRGTPCDCRDYHQSR